MTEKEKRIKALKYLGIDAEDIEYKQAAPGDGKIMMELFNFLKEHGIFKPHPLDNHPGRKLWAQYMLSGVAQGTEEEINKMKEYGKLTGSIF